MDSSKFKFKKQILNIAIMSQIIRFLMEISDFFKGHFKRVW